MTATKFMLGPADTDAVEILDILNATYQAAVYRIMRRDDIKLEDTPAEARAITGQKGLTRLFRVTIEEVQ